MNLAQSLHVDLEPYQIDVKLISPGFVDTPLTEKNTFKMPMIIDADEAARAIANGVVQSRFEIHFPKRFTFCMKLLRMMPYWLYFRLMRKREPGTEIVFPIGISPSKACSLNSSHITRREGEFSFPTALP